MIYHRPVLAQAAVEALITDHAGVYVDATFGGGGHSRLILARLHPLGRLIGIDRDPNAPFSAISDPRFTPLRANFRDLEALLGRLGISSITGLLADLGVSSHQLDAPQRGFSYRVEAPLDLRMDPTTGLPAYEWLPLQSEDTLATILREYGDLPQAKRLARMLLLKRPQTTTDLVTLLQSVYGPRAFAYRAQVFQALRIAINDELNALQALLKAAAVLIRPHGRLVILTYHSGEARYLKPLYQRPIREDPIYGHHQYAWKLICKKRPSHEEIQENPRSRSATLWVLEKLSL